MATKEQNLEFLNNAVSTLTQIATNLSTPKNIRKNITDLIEELKSDEYSMSVRALNTINSLDDVTQDPNLPSYVRTSLWQAVSTLEKGDVIATGTPEGVVLNNPDIPFLKDGDKIDMEIEKLGKIQNSVRFVA